MNPIPAKRSAVSLKYDRSRDQAPRVTAKGQGLMAEKIIDLAHQHNIPIKEDPDLVQILSQVDVQAEIPPSVYHMVAELLAWVYRLNSDYQRQMESNESHTRPI